MKRSKTISFIFLAASAISMAFASTGSAALPVYQGALFFQTIHASSDPEEYSWKVELQPGQELKLIDDQRAEVYFEDGTSVGIIRAEPARDSAGSAVPTDLDISEGDIVTLTVHHRAGNPAAGGAPFAYPVSPGPGFKVGFSTVEVKLPSTEAKEEDAATPVVPGCVVPRLLGKSLKADRKRLKRAGCQLGAVKKVGSATARSGRVIGQSPKPGTVLGSGAVVKVTLGRQARDD